MDEKRGRWKCYFKFLILDTEIGPCVCAVRKKLCCLYRSQRFVCICSSGLEALSCPVSTKFFRFSDLRFTSSLAIATYTLLPAGVLVHRVCKPLTLLSFTVIVCALVVYAFAYFLFSEGQEIFLIQFCQGGKGGSSYHSFGLWVGIEGLRYVLTPMYWLKCP